MDKAQALHTFWSGFGLKAVDERLADDQKTLDDLDVASYIGRGGVKVSFDGDRFGSRAASRLHPGQIQAPST